MSTDRHNFVHKGRMTRAYHIFASVANDASRYMLITTPLLSSMHIIYTGYSDGKYEYLIHEGVTTSNDGTPLVPRNRNRYYSDDTEYSVYETPTITDFGDEILKYIIPGTRFFDLGDEDVFKHNTKYVIEIINRGGAPHDLFLYFSEYESYLG
jgi:hypothetical protein